MIFFRSFHFEKNAVQQSLYWLFTFQLLGEQAADIIAVNVQLSYYQSNVYFKCIFIEC